MNKLDKVSVRLVPEAPLMSRTKISTPEEAVRVIGDDLSRMDREVVAIINLRTDLCPINCSLVSMGALNETVAHPRELLKASILSNAASMIIVHNHPSGVLEPSKEDAQLTDRMVQIGTLIGIPVVDHVIVGGENRSYFSFHEQGLIQYPDLDLKMDYHSIEFPEAQVAEAAAPARKRGR